MLPSLRSGFAVTLSLRGPHEGRLGSHRNGLGACQWAACQHTVRPGTFDVPHEDERTDGWKEGMGGREIEKEGRTGENAPGGRQLWVQPLQGLLFPFHPRFLYIAGVQIQEKEC